MCFKLYYAIHSTKIITFIGKSYFFLKKVMFFKILLDNLIM